MEVSNSLLFSSGPDERWACSGNRFRATDATNRALPSQNVTAELGRVRLDRSAFSSSASYEDFMAVCADSISLRVLSESEDALVYWDGDTEDSTSGYKILFQSSGRVIDIDCDHAAVLKRGLVDATDTLKQRQFRPRDAGSTDADDDNNNNNNELNPLRQDREVLAESMGSQRLARLDFGKGEQGGAASDLLRRHPVDNRPDAFTDKDTAMAVAMGRFFGAKKSPSALVVQIKYILELRKEVDSQTRRRLLLQLYDIDHRKTNRPLEDDQWGPCLDDPSAATADKLELFAPLIAQRLGLVLYDDSFIHDPIRLLDRTANGEWVSETKSENLRILRGYLKDRNLISGTAIDNGDCFYDAVRQGLAKLGIFETIASLREIVYQTILAEPSHYEKVYARSNKQMSWKDYLKRVRCPVEELADQNHPAWGDLAFEGKILAQHFGVQIACYQVLPKKHREEVGLDVIEATPVGAANGKSLEVANFGMHFVPVFPA